MNVLSLFDGISCGHVALDRAGIHVNKYYAAEIDKYAIQVSKNNYPDIIRLGDVTEWREWDLDWSDIDLLIGGSPCQGFSFAGKRLAFDDPRSRLFFVFVDILRHIQKLNPDVKFLLENVKMKQEHLDVITYHLDTDPVLINSALVSAQHRERYYWTNWQIDQPEDKKILLRDIIEHEHDNSVLCSPEWAIWWDKNKEKQEQKHYSQVCNDKEKALTLTARMYGSWNGNFIKVDNVNPSGQGMNGNVYSIHGKSPTLTTNKGEGMKICSNRLHLCGYANIKDHDYNRRVYGISGKSPTLIASHGGNKEPKIAVNKIRWRKLTPVECERLQTLPDNYTARISNSQRYKCLGNGWTVDVIAHIFKSMHVQKIKQMRLFA